ncbi:hypothetical protein QW060_22155, partial [Myroides ceti]
GAERVTFSLEHTIDPKEWNAKKEEVKHEDVYYFTLLNFKKYLTNRYHELKSEGKENILTILKNEAATYLTIQALKELPGKCLTLKMRKMACQNIMISF